MVEQSWLFSKMGLVATKQILLPIISMKMSLIIPERKFDLLILVTLIQVIMQFGTSWKKWSTRMESDMKTSKGFQQWYDMHVIHWQKLISNSIYQWWMRLEKVVEESGGHIEHLIWQHWLMILCTFL